MCLDARQALGKTHDAGTSCARVHYSQKLGKTHDAEARDEQTAMHWPCNIGLAPHALVMPMQLANCMALNLKNPVVCVPCHADNGIMYLCVCCVHAVSRL